MSITPEQFKQLDAPLHVDAIKTREQSGQTLSYVDAWYITDRLNKVMQGDWSRATDAPAMVQCELKPGKSGGENWYVGYTARCSLTVGSITRDGYGFGQGIDRDLGRAHESAIKEAETDAFKRAVMTLGSSMGLALYDKSKSQVETPVVIRPLGRDAYAHYLTECEFTPDEKARMLDRLRGKENPTTFLAKCKHDGLKTTDAIFARMDEEYPVTPSEASVAAQRPLEEART